MIITGVDSVGIYSLQRFLNQHFEMKDLGTFSYFLKLEVTSSSDGYYLSQAKYASDLLSKAGITDNKIVSTPLEYNAKLTPLDGEPISDATRYCQLVGSLIYLTITRPDISHAVGMVSKFMDAPRSVYYAVVLRILQYATSLASISRKEISSCSPSPLLTSLLISLLRLTRLVVFEILYPNSCWFLPCYLEFEGGC